MNETAEHQWWIPLADLMMRPAEWRNKRRVVTIAQAEVYTVDMGGGFLALYLA